MRREDFDAIAAHLASQAKCEKAQAQQACLCDECCALAEFLGYLQNFGRPWLRADGSLCFRDVPASSGKWSAPHRYGPKPKMVGRRR